MSQNKILMQSFCDNYTNIDRFLPPDARNAKRGIAIVSRPSVRNVDSLRYRRRIPSFQSAGYCQLAGWLVGGK